MKNKEIATKPKETIMRIWNYSKEYKNKILLVICMILISTIATVIAPIIILKIVDDYIMVKKLEGLFILLLILFFIYIVISLFNYITGIIMLKVSESSLYKIRRDLFDHLQKLPLSFFDKNKKGDIMSRFTNDITVISEVMSDAFIQVISSLILLVGVTIIMFIVNPILAFTTIITIPIFFILVVKIGQKVGELFKKRQNSLGELNSFSEEAISGINIVKSFGKEKENIENFNNYNSDLKNISIKSQLYANLIMPLNVTVTNIGNILLVAVGALLTVKGQATVGSILAFLTYAAMFRRPINMLANIFASIQSALAGSERIFEILDTKIEINDDEKSINMDKIRGEVEFVNVSFNYEQDELVLKNVNLKVEGGQSIAIVGPTGAGKTTIINLLSRFYDLNSGIIKIDSLDISKINKKDLRRKIGIVLQDNYLFKGTVLENIRYGNKEASLEEVKEACKKAQVHSFIRRLPNGYNSEVEEEGSNFSQGQRQLMSIARAILADHEILILDEATSNIDTKTEQDIQKGMQELMKGKTSFIIAHRLSTIVNVDKIIVINEGKIIEAGDHNSLIKNRGFYYKLYTTQFDE